MSRSYQRFRLPSGWRSFLQHDGGGVTVFAVIAFSMLLVVIGLIVDVGRVMNVHSESGSYADRAALAAAAELDGRSCAVVRAVAAVTGRDGSGCNFDRLIPAGRRLTLSGDSFVSVQRMTFYSSLSPQTITARWERGNQNPSFTSGQANANRTTRFVMVETTRETEQFLFFPMLGGSLQSATVAPRATAGFERRVCNSIPVMVCNPDEDSGNGVFNAQRGRDFRASLHYSNPYFNWIEDNEYTLLDVPNRSPPALENYMRSSNPNTQCYSRRVGVEQDFNREQREAILEGLEERNDDTFPVAIVNCRQYRSRLNGSQADDPIPVETWALLEVEDTYHQRHSNPVVHDHYYVEFEVQGLMPADENVTREFPVLVR